MLSLLSPRLWLALALVAVLSFTHFSAYRSGKANVRMEWQAATAAANAEARSLEQQRQRRADEAAQLAASRASRIAADARNARSERDGLRDDLNAVRLHAEKSSAAAADSIRTLSDVFGQCVGAYTELAEEADRAYSEALTLRQAWPK